jgi:hypothetical protein
MSNGGSKIDIGIRDRDEAGIEEQIRKNRKNDASYNDDRVGTVYAAGAGTGEGSCRSGAGVSLPGPAVAEPGGRAGC